MMRTSNFLFPVICICLLGVSNQNVLQSALERQPMKLMLTVPTSFPSMEESYTNYPNREGGSWTLPHSGNPRNSGFRIEEPYQGRSSGVREESSRNIKMQYQQVPHHDINENFKVTLPQFYDSTERTQAFTSNIKSLRFNARNEKTTLPQHNTKNFPKEVLFSTTDGSITLTPTNQQTPQTSALTTREQARGFDIRDDRSKFFLERDEKKKQAFFSRNEPRQLSQEAAVDHASSDKLVKFSTSNPIYEDKENEKSTNTLPTITEETETEAITDPDRMALIRGRHRDIPQLVFLADDPEAASRIPDLLTTYYDGGQSTRNRPGMGFSYNGRSGIITTTTQDDAEIYTAGPETVQIYPQKPISERNLDLGESQRDGHSSDYFPPRFRPSFGTQEKDHFPDFGSSYSSFGSVKHPTGLTSGGGRQPKPNFTKRLMNNMTRVTHIEAECQDDFMRIHVVFNGSFEGLVYSAGYSHDLDCVYINGSGRHTYEFYIKLNRCGTLGANDLGDSSKLMQKNVMWNTLTVQYNPMIEEEWDEHFKVTCEYGLEIWKTVTFPFLDVEVQTGNPMMFTLNPPECHMEIRQGFSPDGKRVSSPVRVGDPLTLVIYMRSQYDGFDIVVSDCFAHNGGTKKILLIDSYGCPVDDKLISHFDGQSLRDGLFETQVFAFMKTFRFTGSPALYIECGVRMCHGDCPSQLCHWRRSRTGKSRRSVSPEVPEIPKNSSSLHLFQALQVINDGSPPFGGPSIYAKEEYCFKTNHFTVAAGAAGSILSIFVIACFILCFRLRRIGKRSSVDGLPSPQPSTERNYRSSFVPPVKRRLE